MIEFLCNDPDCTGHKMSILDWGFAQLYRKVIKSVDWQNKIKPKILDQIFSENHDTQIMLGNMVSHPQTFSVLGFFWPPKKQGHIMAADGVTLNNESSNVRITWAERFNVHFRNNSLLNLLHGTVSRSEDSFSYVVRE